MPPLGFKPFERMHCVFKLLPFFPFVSVAWRIENHMLIREPKIMGEYTMTTFLSYSGVVTMIRDFQTGAKEPSGCYKFISVRNTGGGTVNFIAAPYTYFIDNVCLMVGDPVTGFYDANAPVPMIYPPQYQAIVMTKISPSQNVKVDYFDDQLISSDGMLKLNVDPFTQMQLENGQTFTRDPANRNLIVLYGPSTRSIPAQTTPYKIIVMCR